MINLTGLAYIIMRMGLCNKNIGYILRYDGEFSEGRKNGLGAYYVK